MKIKHLLIWLACLGFGVAGNLKSQTANAKPIPTQTGKLVHNPNIGMCNQAYDTLHYKQLANCPLTVLDDHNMKITSFEASFFHSEGGCATEMFSGNKLGSGFINDMRQGKAIKIYIEKIKATDGNKTIDLGSTIFFVKCPNCW